jgi:hypothetical protein
MYYISLYLQCSKVSEFELNVVVSWSCHLKTWEVAELIDPFCELFCDTFTSANCIVSNGKIIILPFNTT